MKEHYYANDDITIVWRPELCTHAGLCVKTLPQVYNPKERPWVKIENATTEQLIHQIGLCPSKALTFKYNSEMTRLDQEDNGKKGRFIIYEGDTFAGEMTYVWAGENKIIIDHTGVEPAFEGKGYGKELLAKAVAFAREKNIKILPLCPFAKKGFDKDPNIQDVKA
ncbi:hypothetical protein RCZ04_05540 [Capnocytophaga sp. HP1101]